MHKYAEIGSSLEQGKTEEKIAFTCCRKHHINRLPVAYVNCSRSSLSFLSYLAISSKLLPIHL